MILEYASASVLLQLVWQQLWIGTALVLLVALGLRLGRGWNAATRHWIWAVTLLALALLPLAALLPQSTFAPPIFEAGVDIASRAPSNAAATAVPGPATSQAEPALVAQTLQRWRSLPTVRTLASALLVLWLAGTAWMLVRLVQSARAAERLRRDAVPAPVRGIAAEVRISNAAPSPMVVGLLHPCILLPASMEGTVPVEILDRLLRHELAHLRRRDHWLMLVQRLIEALYFFHPGVLYAARRLDDEREISCDDYAAAGDRNRYAKSLVQVGRNMVLQRAARPLAVGALRSKRQLARRVSQLLDSECNHAPGASRGGLALGSVLIIALVAGASELMPRLSRADDTPSRQFTDLSALDAGYETALMAAAERGDAGATGALLENGADPNQAFDGDGTPLIVAARNGHLPLVRLLLDYGADVNGAVEGDGNPLIMAAAHGNTEVARLLLDYGADIDAVVPGDENALISAARSGAYDSVKLLLERGADVDVGVPAMRFDGEMEERTALNQARAHGFEAIERLLIEYGATH